MFRSTIARIPSSILGNKGCWTRFVAAPHRFCHHRNENIDEWVSCLPEDVRKRIRLIQNEIALKQAELKKMPQVAGITIVDYKNMLEMSNSRRQRYYGFLFKSQTAEANDEVKKLIREKVYEQKIQLRLANPSHEHIDYALGKNTLFFKIRNQTINRWLNQKLSRAMIRDDPPLVFDFAYNDSMTKYEIMDTAKQIKYAFTANRQHVRPFVMHLCNIDKNSDLWREITQLMPNIEQIPIKIHAADITDIFPPEKLVYLSPDALEPLTSFNTDDRYIVGGLVDKGNSMPLSLAKAKKLNIRSARLPLEKYVRMNSHKTLTLDQMTKILLELKTSQSWPEAFKKLPTRKLQ